MKILPKFTLLGRSKEENNMFMSRCAQHVLMDIYIHGIIPTKRPKRRFIITLLLLRKLRFYGDLETCPTAWSL